MRRANIVQIPNALRRGWPIDSLAEKSKLEAKAPALRRSNISSVVPPLGPKVGMIEVVARKFETIIRECEAIRIVGCRRAHCKCQRQNDKMATLHELPRWEPGRWRSWPGTKLKERLQHKQ